MKCSAHVYSLNFLYVTRPLLLKMSLLSLDSLQKVGYLARPAGGAVENNRQLVSPVTVPTPEVTTFRKLCMSKRKNLHL